MFTQHCQLYCKVTVKLNLNYITTYCEIFWGTISHIPPKHTAWYTVQCYQHHKMNLSLPGTYLLHVHILKFEILHSIFLSWVSELIKGKDNVRLRSIPVFQAPYNERFTITCCILQHFTKASVNTKTVVKNLKTFWQHQRVIWKWNSDFMNLMFSGNSAYFSK